MYYIEPDYYKTLKLKIGLNIVSNDYIMNNYYSHYTISKVNGILVANSKCILKHCNDKTYFIHVIIPNNANITNITTYFDSDITYFTTDKIIIPHHHKYNLYDLKTIIKFNINISGKYLLTLTPYLSYKYLITPLIDFICYTGNLNTLIWLKNTGLPFIYSDQAMSYATVGGHTDVLDWWKNSGLELKYNKYTILEDAFIKGNINTIKWWINSSLDFQYSGREFDLALRFAHKDMLAVLRQDNHPNIINWLINLGIN
jgi:hypothetical protein